MKKNVLVFLLFMFAFITMNAQVVITEIMYNNEGDDDLEFIELYNSGNAAVDLEGYTFTSGINFTFPSHTLNAGEFVLVATDSIFFDAVFGLPAYEWTSGALTNSGETIELSDAAGEVIDEVAYDDADPWSTFTDGSGPSISICDPSADNNDAANWQASTTVTGIELSNLPLLANPNALATCSERSLISLDEFEMVVNEDAGTIEVAVLIENPTNLATTVDITIAAVTSATEGEDFQLSSNMVTFPADATDAQTFEITINNDMDIESQELIAVVLRNPSNDAILLTDSLSISLIDNDAPLERQMILTGVFDAQFPGTAGARGFEIFVTEDIADISNYGIGVANNGGGSDGLEWNFDAVSASAGDFLYIAEDSTEFHDYFGFAPNFESGIANINGDDSVELYENDQVIDVFGDVEIDGSNEPWEYEDGWAYRILGTGPDGNTFVLGNWILGGIDALDGVLLNSEAPNPFPIGTYSIPTVVTAQNDQIMGMINMPIEIDVLANDFIPGTVVSVTPILSSETSGSIAVNTDFSITYTPEQDFCGVDMFSYEVCDETTCAQATVSISIDCPPSYTAYPIGLVSTVNAFGIADSLGTECELAGRVYGVNIKNDGGLSFVIIDENNDGIVVYNENENFGYMVNEGDEVVVQGVIGQFNGLTEIIADNVEMTTLGINEVEPLVVTSLGEETESQLVLIEKLDYVDVAQWDNTLSANGFNVDMTNGIDTFTIRIDNDTELYNMEAPNQGGGNYVTGLGGQFDFSNPFTEGYQLLPRYLSDFQILYNTKNQELQTKVSVFPNPTSNIVFLETAEVIDRIQLNNTLGQMVRVIEQPNLREQVNVSNLPKGVYTVTFEKDGLRSVKRLILQ